MGKRGGYKPKDHVIADGFNENKKGKLSKEELAAAKRAGLAKGRAIIAARRAAAQGAKTDKAGIPKDTPVEEDEANASMRMLADMRHVYKKLKGREKLEKLMKSDREFLFMIKELMKIESAQLTAKIRAKEGPEQDNRMVFVVLKGLEEEKKFLDVTDKDVDLKQISSALNPDGSEYSH